MSTEQEIRKKTEDLLVAYDHLCREVRNISISDFLLLRAYAEKEGSVCGKEGSLQTEQRAPQEKREKAPPAKKKKEIAGIQKEKDQENKDEAPDAEVPAEADNREAELSVFELLRGSPDPYN